MKILIDIADNDASFAMKVLKSLSFVKKAKPMNASTTQLWEDLKVKKPTSSQVNSKRMIDSLELD